LLSGEIESESEANPYIVSFDTDTCSGLAFMSITVTTTAFDVSFMIFTEMPSLLRAALVFNKNSSPPRIEAFLH
jgi:hypothetical protein